MSLLAVGRQCCLIKVFIQMLWEPEGFSWSNSNLQTADPGVQFSGEDDIQEILVAYTQRINITLNGDVKILRYKKVNNSSAS